MIAMIAIIAWLLRLMSLAQDVCVDRPTNAALLKWMQARTRVCVSCSSESIASTKALPKFLWRKRGVIQGAVGECQSFMSKSI